MGSNRLALVFLGVACVAAAGGGSYLATRHNVSSLAVPAASADSATPTAATPESSTVPTLSVVATPLVTPPQAEAAVAAAPKPAPATPSRPAAQVVSAARPVQPVSGPSPEDPATARVEDVHAQDRSMPPPPAPQAGSTPSEVLSATPTDDDHPVELQKAAEPPAGSFQELVVSADSVIGLQMEGLLSSERARVEDRVEARVSRDVRVGGQVAIPAGTHALGSVVIVERGGRVRQPARLGIRFNTLIMADGTRMPISTETIFRMGDAPGNGSAAKIGGGAVAGAILGAIIGGGKGAAIGATTGAGAGTAAVMTGDRSAATFPPGSEVTARILSPITVTIERE